MADYAIMFLSIHIHHCEKLRLIGEISIDPGSKSCTNRPIFIQFSIGIHSISSELITESTPAPSQGKEGIGAAGRVSTSAAQSSFCRNCHCS
jgi:hypothetical protein